MKKQWPKINKVMKNGKPMVMVDARLGGNGERRYFDTKAEADGFAQTQRVRRQNQGGAAFDDRELAAFGLTIADAIRFTLAHYRRQNSSVAIAEAVEQMIATKRGAGASDGYCRVLRLNLGKVASHFDGQKLTEISTANIESFLAGLAVTGSTRNTFRRDIRTLWSFAEKQGWAKAEVAKNTERAKVIDAPPGILTPEQAAALLTESKDNDLLAFHAIGLFAGLRVAEIKKLDWRDVDLAGEFINVAAAVSKTRSRRLVPIQGNLKAWLAPIAKKSGPVVERELRTRHEGARKRAGIVSWPDNAMRHSFVSYRLASTGNAAQTALESGHDQAVLFAHYREIVKPKAAAQFFALAPAKAGKIISMAA